MLKLFSSRARRWIYPLISLVLAVSLCLGQPVVAQALPWIDLIMRGIQIAQLSNLSPRQEVAIGQQINNELVGKQVRLYRDRALNQYIDEIGQRLARTSSRNNISYKFQIVDSSKINAFATMGGFVYVHTGLIAAADNEAQLASVIGHEIGHIAARHSIKQMRELAIASGLATAAGLDRNTVVALGVDLALRRPNSRAAEYEADQLGLVNLGRAGYALAAMPAFMEKLVSGPSVPTIVSTHPATGDRIERLRQAIDTAGPDQGGGLDRAAYRAKIRAVL